MARAGLVAAALALSALVAAAAPAVRGCIRGTCRTQAKACAAAFRDGKAVALEACGAKRKHDPCRQAVRRSVRDGVRACRASARSCVQCCRRSVGPCAVGVCGNARVEAGEDCDGASRGACSRGCRADCTCEPSIIVPVCGNGTIELGEACEPNNAPACPERCRADCTCQPVPSPCGNGVLDDGEECDASSDSDCAGRCRADCTCAPIPTPECGNGVAEDGEDCDSTDDFRCPGGCRSDCLCAECGNDVLDPGEECEPSDAETCGDVCSEVSCMCVSSTTDDCSAPRRLEPLPAVDRQVVVAATTAPDDPLVECVELPGPHEHSVWYVVTAPAIGRLRVDTAGSTYDTILLAHTGTCGELTTVACNDDNGGQQARLDVPVAAGTDYLLEALSYRRLSAGELRLDVSFRPCGDGVVQDGEACEPGVPGSCATGPCTEDCVCLAPLVDECAAAVVAALPIDLELDGSTATGNALDPQLSCTDPAASTHSVWFRFVAPVDGTVRVYTTGSDYDTVLGVFTGGCDGLTERECDDDEALFLATSRTDVAVAAGTTYTVMVTPYQNDSPTRLRLHIGYLPAP